MPICRRSNLDRAFLLAGTLLIACPALAQDKAQPAATSTDARAAAQAQGDAVMERLKAAIAAQQKQASTATPAVPALPALPDSERRRSFEGLHRRAPSPAMDARARSAFDHGQAGLAEQREAMAKRVAQALGLEAPDTAALAGGIAPLAPKTRVPVIFASSSMPLDELRAYAAQLEPVGGVIAFRGMPGGLTRIGPMAKLTAQMLRLDPGCEGPACVMRKVQVIVDPLVFRQHGVTRVPALTLIPGDPTQPYCEREDNSPHGNHVVYGDTALSGLLDEYARLGGQDEVRDVQTSLERR
ncbi:MULTISPECIES: type-F conjugative transfer system pilin assembly protein TrbC [unclassified Novosphingobium]|uniref:type-F conjugative transfer system pilin assembly protein TrbC n=1 Tax=unclassified Novosphingobium TaxID=2644732 RepID=UPI000D30D119|nr:MULTISPECIES: type-F conjugative transfer system pilin assembly protein TrbC [unclassified Novosphingobium]PTR12611.1 type F conjugative transfer system pilin assembly protein [Novosphingobium sp. GV055]PUB06395.1 type F conjugative transfer system pilin assembly protein [Novosphingobium sp. GV061]PUB22446.1 type F conjugative transfer system pilin assembly protein [Novosphingobium sp. GV079]PUB44471.1 type F conjugative transfer system pilin assembly protein [Novosphingobium sp. GV027]